MTSRVVAVYACSVWQTFWGRRRAFKKQRLSFLVQQKCITLTMSFCSCFLSSSPTFPAQGLAAVKFDGEPFWVSSGWRWKPPKNIAFLLIAYTTLRNISKCLDVCGGPCIQRGPSASVPPRTSRKPRHDSINQTEDDGHVTKATKLARMWNMFTGSHLLSERIRKIHWYSLAAQGGFCRHEYVDGNARVTDVRGG